ncbi:MAG TPA: glycosyltransferase family 4 protein [Terriglobales bacterium]|jgi:glycosyltransferase involved in cell wall biosynthesis|nr:glycosyltransferase family 4 protein [Terriglobales bacterium]
MSLPNTVLPKVLLEVVVPRTLIRGGAAVDRARLRSKPSLPSRIAVIGNYLPRHCGIATFTTDLCGAISTECGSARLLALPVNDTEAGYDYPDRVRWSLAQDDVQSYQQAAEFLNFNNIDMVCLQHEYGIFGGPAGSHILHLLRGLKMPVVTTLHTVLREPNPDQMLVMEEIAELSDRLIVMSQLSSQFLQEIFKVPGRKIDTIPHGVPDLPFLDPNFYKDRFGVEGHAVLLTFGLLSPNKGIENVIQALPQILSKHKNVVYIVAGATHPHILRREGDIYRASLQALAKEAGVESQVIFHDRFVSPGEMVEFIGAADIYITPYRHEAQVVSGTLAYALGAGKAIISTPYWHAVELLDDRRGALVPFQNPDAIAKKTIELLDTPAIRHAMRKRAYLFAREMVWKRVAQGYMESFARVRSDRMEGPKVQFSAQITPKSLNQLPCLKLNHLNQMTDDTGILQHAIFTIPNRGEGYTTDDNARALIFAVLADLEKEPLRETGLPSEKPALYLSFLEHAFNLAKGRFKNFLGYDRRWYEPVGSEDCHGRALWSLGTILGRSQDEGMRGAAGRLFEFSLPTVLGFSSPRAWAYTLLGIQEYLTSYPGDRDAQRVRSVLGQRLLEMYESIRRPEWKWFENVLAYGNARLPQALLLVGSACSDDRMVSAGLESLDWLSKAQHYEINGHFVPIGSQGFYRQDGDKARFDQQPLEAAGAVSACLQAYRVTSDSRWRDEAWSAFNWFLGDNDLQLPLYDSGTGGCRDGLHPDRANENQGAESTLSFLMALLEMRSLQKPQQKEIFS